MDLCKNIFGEGIFPDVDATNLYYGGTKIAGLEAYLCLNFYSLFFRHSNKTCKIFIKKCAFMTLTLPLPLILIYISRPC